MFDSAIFGTSPVLQSVLVLSSPEICVRIPTPMKSRHLLTCTRIPGPIVLNMIFPRCVDVAEEAAGHNGNRILTMVDAGKV